MQALFLFLYRVFPDIICLLSYFVKKYVDNLVDNEF